jgi:hypothetical protein
MKLKPALILFLFFTIFFKLNAQPEKSSEEFQVVKDLRSEILVYDSDFSSYVPYNSDLHSGTRYITLRLDSSYLSQYPLVSYLSANAAFFLDNKLFYQQKTSGWVIFNSRQLGKATWLTIFHPTGDLPVGNLFYGFKIGEKAPVKVTVNRLETRPYDALTFENFFIIFFVLILVVLVISKVFNNKAYNEFYNLRRNTLTVGKDQNYIFKKPMNSNNLLALLIHCMIFVFVLFVVQYLTGGIIHLPLFSPESSLGDLVGRYFTITVIAFIIYILKYFLIAFISYLYNVKEYRLTHYFNWVKLSMLFYLLILPIIGLIYIWYHNLNGTLIKNIVFFSLILFSIAKIIIISYNLNKIRQFRNLYLFSYLCATEIIPLFIVFKLLI